MPFIRWPSFRRHDGLHIRHRLSFVTIFVIFQPTSIGCAVNLTLTCCTWRQAAKIIRSSPVKQTWIPQTVVEFALPSCLQQRIMAAQAVVLITQKVRKYEEWERTMSFMYRLVVKNVRQNDKNAASSWTYTFIIFDAIHQFGAAQQVKNWHLSFPVCARHAWFA